MNAYRRKQLEKVEDLISEARCLLEDVMSEEQEAYDNMPESLQGSERGEAMSDGLSEMEDIVSNLEDAESSLQDIRNA